MDKPGKLPRFSMPLFLHPRGDVRLSEKHTARSYLEERLREDGVLQKLSTFERWIGGRVLGGLASSAPVAAPITRPSSTCTKAICLNLRKVSE